MLMATKPGRVIMIYLEWLLLKHGHIITWSCKIMLQTETLHIHQHNVYGYQYWQGGDIE